MKHNQSLTYVDHYQTSQQCRKKTPNKTVRFCSRNKPNNYFGKCALCFSRSFLVKIASIYVEELIQKYQETNSLESYLMFVAAI